MPIIPADLVYETHYKVLRSMSFGEIDVAGFMATEIDKLIVEAMQKYEKPKEVGIVGIQAFAHHNPIILVTVVADKGNKRRDYAKRP